MCGRYVQRTALQHVMELFGALPGELLSMVHDLSGISPEREPNLFEPVAADRPPRVPGRYNIAPTQDVPVVRLDTGGTRRLEMLHWGLVPPWAEDRAVGNKMINARAETAASRPAYRDAFRRRRCLVVADGFYEWKTTGKHKQPYFVHRRDGQPFAFGGLWEHWHRGAAALDSCTILTTTPDKLMAALHSRMPVIIPPEKYQTWLDGQTPAAAVADLLHPQLADQWVADPVSTRVNNIRNDDSECIEPLTPADTEDKDREAARQNGASATPAGEI